MIRIVIVIAFLLALCAPARAGTLVEIPKTAARLDLPDGWQPLAARGTVIAYKHERGSVLAITRADVPNPNAWRSEKRQAYVDEIEAGIAARIAGYKRTKKRVVTAGGIPALDVEATRDGGATVLIRVLLFRTYALALAIEVPKGGDVAAARPVIAAFSPPK